MKYQKLDGSNVLKDCLFVVHRMSAGSGFHATGSEKLKARSLNLVRSRGTTNFGAEHVAERSPWCDGVAGSTIVRRYSGHVPTTIPYISMTSLYCTRQRIGSQWSWIRLSVTWSRSPSSKIAELRHSGHAAKHRGWTVARQLTTSCNSRVWMWQVQVRAG